jgi:signal transduction histidine kinase
MHMDHELRVRHAGRSLQYAEAAARAQHRLVEPTERATALKIAIDALEVCTDLVGASAVEIIDGSERPVASFGDLDALSDDAFPDAPDDDSSQAIARRGRVVMPVMIDDVQEATITVQSKSAIQSVEDETIGSIASAVTGSIARYRAASTIEGLRRSTTRRLVEAQERERSMVAADIHDGVLQQLGATAIRLELAQSRVEQRDFDTASSIIADGANEIRYCARELRSLLMELRPQVLDDNGLNAALSELGRHVDEVDVTVTSDVPDELSSEFSITIFRIVQEALTNIQKHARASHATVDVKLLGDSIAIDIGDDGIGYEGAVTGPSAEGSHLGLLGMRERARMFGGSFSIAGASGGGTEIHATLPLTGLTDHDLIS